MTALNEPISLCFIGPMVGRHPGYVTTQGLILADRFSDARYRVYSASSKLNRFLRLGDIVRTLLGDARQSDIQCLEVYGGRSFLVEDIASFLGKLVGQRVVMVLHGGDFPKFMAKWPNWTARVLGRADAIVTPSRYLARSAKPLHPNVRVIPNVIDVIDYPFRLRERARPNLLWLRTFHEYWNPFMAVRVVVRLRQLGHDATLTMAGQDKGLRTATIELAQKFGVADAISFPGFLDHDGKLQAAENADILINTNRVDNMPVALIEAAAFGMPIVSTKVGGIPDLLEHRKTGILVPSEDEEAMAAAIVELISNPELAATLSTNGRALAESCSWGAVRPQWESLFQEILA